MIHSASKKFRTAAFIASLCILYSFSDDNLIQKPDESTGSSIRINQSSLKMSLDNLAVFACGTEQIDGESVQQLYLALRSDAHTTKMAGIIKKEAITENGVVENPLWNKRIKFFTPISRTGVLIVLEEQPEILYGLIYDKANNSVSLLDSIKTADRCSCEEIVNISSVTKDHLYVVAKQKKDAPFGRQGTGIAAVQIGKKSKNITIKQEEKNISFLDIKQITQIQKTLKDAVPGTKKNQFNTNQYNYAIECTWDEFDRKNESEEKEEDVTPVFFDFGENKDIFGTNVDIEVLQPGMNLHYDLQSSNTLLSLHCKTGNTNTNVAHTTLSINWQINQDTLIEESNDQEKENNTVVEKKITPQSRKYLVVRSIFKDITPMENNNYILATNKAADWIRNEQIIPIRVSTRYDYLIIRSHDIDNAQRIFLVPSLVGSNSIIALANKNSLIEKSYGDPIRRTRSKMGFGRTPAKNDSDIPTMQDNEYIINTDNLPGTITHIESLEDCILVSTEEDDKKSNETSGIFMTHALFNAAGKVVGWTKWKRVNAIQGSIKHFRVSPQQQTLFYVQNSVSGDSIKTSSLDIMSSVSKEQKVSLFQEIIKAEGGIRIIENLFTGSSNDNIIALLNQSRLTLINAGQGAESITSLISADNANGNNCVHIVDDVIKKIGTLKNIILAYDHFKIQAWIMIAGDKGIAFLRNSDGSGISTQSSGAEFLAQAQQQKFAYINTDFHIKKILTAHGSLFILTDKQLYRINLDENELQSNMHGAVKLIDQSDLLLFDVIISGPLIALATSKGLLRNGDGTQASRIGVDQPAQWTEVSLPYQVKPTIKFQLINENPIDLDSEQVGMLYVIGSFRGQHRSTLHRLAIKKEPEITETTLLPVEDYRYPESAPFLATHVYQEHFFTTGLQYYSMFKNKHGNRLAYIEHGKVKPISFEDDESLNTMGQCQATGQYLIAGSHDFYISR